MYTEESLALIKEALLVLEADTTEEAVKDELGRLISAPYAYKCGAAKALLKLALEIES